MDGTDEAPKSAAEADAIIARRLDALMQASREYEQKLRRILEMKRLRRRLERAEAELKKK